ncbi:sodium/potassium-transporting ATPase subunit beta-2-like [Ischnura elegans]|uniref:sodium/potassium-transporting ATPase subunit beta-2-like n=1 Tax=Ischnura elegans TaxID=197161 RepID=UPI001ED893C1|nr:sodium/potassium-transporting ATPase subunit beta-2-like [Ischnura elegans]
MAFFPRKYFFLAFIISYFALINATTVPELKYHPKLPSLYEPTLIWYRANDEGNVTAMTQNLDKFLEGYNRPGLIAGRGQSVIHCDFSRPPKGEEVCDVNGNEFTPCISGNRYGYDRGSPCIFLSLDKIVGWTPEFYNDSSSLPADMPEDLKNHIADLKRRDPKTANQLWVTCSGENPADIENLGAMQYIPARGFPGYFFPFSNAQGNLSPLVALRLERPQRGILLNIECKLWARNLKNSAPEKQGVLHFELLVD